MTKGMKIKYTACSIVLVACFLLCERADALAVMSVDFGSEWMKIAVVYPGVPMEIALNKESKRKTPIAISFRNNEREIGDDALSSRVRSPESTYTNLLDLLGKNLDNPSVQYYKKLFPYHRIAADPETGTVVFELPPDNTAYSVEELLSMILRRAKDIAEDYSEQSIKDIVITVPAYFNQAERRALVLAAELANMKVLQLINDNTAVALNYGVFRRKDFNSTVQNIMFYDMGASSTGATIVGYQVVKTKERGFVETNPQLTILGYGYDRSLGGTEFTVRLRNHLAKVFNSMKKTTKDVFQQPRALAKLHKEAERVKMILSANSDHVAQVENLLDDIDFKAPMQRAEFEELCKDLFERVGTPVTTALKNAGMTMDDIDSLILVGAGTRIPKIQEILLDLSKKSELGKNLNTDEAAALGAVYQAAHLSQGFKVKKFLIRDAVLYPIQVDFERELESEDNVKGSRIVSRTLFGFLNPYPLKKVMTFNRLHKNEFDFSVNYGDLKMTEEEKKYFGSVNISRIHLTGIKDAMDKHLTDGSESKGVKAHFRMDESGILSLDFVECVFENKEAASDPAADLESAFSRLGSTISQLFSGGSPSEEETPKQDDIPVEGEKTSDIPKKEEEKNTTSATNTSETGNATKAEKKPKVVLVKEPIEITQEKVDLKEPLQEQIQKMMKRIETLDKMERTRKEKEETKNNLEAFILDTQDKLYQEEYEQASTEEEREKIRTEMSTLSEWLYEEGDNMEADVYRNKLKDLQLLTKDIFLRVKEHHDRPEASNALRDLLNMSDMFLQKARALSEEEQYFSTVELDTLEKAIEDTKKWKAEKEEEQAKHPLTQAPKLTVRQIAEKLAFLDREVKYLLNKARTTKPKEKTKVDPAANANATNTTEGAQNTTSEEETLELPAPETTESETKPTAENEKEKSEDVTNASKPTPEGEKHHTEL